MTPPLTVYACLRCGYPEPELTASGICQECEYQMQREEEHELLVQEAEDMEEAEAVARYGVMEAYR